MDTFLSLVTGTESALGFVSGNGVTWCGLNCGNRIKVHFRVSDVWGECDMP